VEDGNDVGASRCTQLDIPFSQALFCPCSKKAQVFERILFSPDPTKALRNVLGKREQEEAREAYYDEHGEYPPG
jgi:hypothetical protein